MISWVTFLVVYLFGGLTFLPLLFLLAVYIWTQAPSPSSIHRGDASTADSKGSGSNSRSPHDSHNYDGVVLPGDDLSTLETVRREHALERESRVKRSSQKKGDVKHRFESPGDFATAGYFAVFRKYVAMGVNSKPVEPSSVGPASMVPPSPSVYQTFFRNVLNKKPGPESVEISNAASPRPKNARNMFYIVLRHGHLILFDDDQQVDVRHVIKLADYDVGVYSGGGVIPEGEMFIKRNALWLSPRNLERAKAHNAPTPQPWYFYCENCSDKEDFYVALLHSQEQPPCPYRIDVRHLTGLMERLHASEEAAEMRWFNALVGRLFLGVYKTPDLLAFLQAKIVTKLSRTPRPGFFSSLVVQRIDVGDATPQITSPRLKSLTAEGECVVEADMRYTGRFEVDIAATIRVSTPIGTQEVKTSLAVVLTRLDGHVLFRIKAPPSNRVWFSFRHMPKIEMEIRPIILARQLTWPLFLQVIEGKIKEAIAESVVLPFWDDMPFFPTDHKTYRGGLWKDKEENNRKQTSATGVSEPVDKRPADGDAQGTAAKISMTSTVLGPGDDENVSPAVLRLRRLSKSFGPPTPSPALPILSLTSNSAAPGGNDLPGKSNSKKSSTQASFPTGITDTDTTSVSSPQLVSQKHVSSSIQIDAAAEGNAEHADQSLVSSSASGLSEQGSISRTTVPINVYGNPGFESTSAVESGFIPGEGENSILYASPQGTELSDELPAPTSFFAGTGSETSSVSLSKEQMTSGGSDESKTASPEQGPLEASLDTAAPPKRTVVLAAAMSGAAATAKRWGITAFQRRAAASESNSPVGASRRSSNGEPLDLSKPMGGGHPLPPPGEPLPMPGELLSAKETLSYAISTEQTKSLQPQSAKRQDRAEIEISQPRATLDDQTGLKSERGKSRKKHHEGKVDNGFSSADDKPNRNFLSSASVAPENDLLVVEAPIDMDSEDGECDAEVLTLDAKDDTYRLGHSTDDPETVRHAPDRAFGTEGEENATDFGDTGVDRVEWSTRRTSEQVGLEGTFSPCDS